MAPQYVGASLLTQGGDQWLALYLIGRGIDGSSFAFLFDTIVYLYQNTSTQ